MLTCHRPTMPLTWFAAGSIKYSLCTFRQIGNFRVTFRTNALLHRLTLSPTVFAVVSIGYSLCISRQLACFRLTIIKYTHLPSPDTASDRVCRGLDRAFTMKLWTVGIIPINNPQICSMSSPDTVSDSVCRCLDRIFSLQV